jgi:hypothetical protein
VEPRGIGEGKHPKEQNEIAGSVVEVRSLLFGRRFVFVATRLFHGPRCARRRGRIGNLRRKSGDGRESGRGRRDHHWRAVRNRWRAWRGRFFDRWDNAGNGRSFDRRGNAGNGWLFERWGNAWYGRYFQRRGNAWYGRYFQRRGNGWHGRYLDRRGNARHGRCFQRWGNRWYGRYLEWWGNAGSGRSRNHGWQ